MDLLVSRALVCREISYKVISTTDSRLLEWKEDFTSMEFLIKILKEL